MSDTLDDLATCLPSEFLTGDMEFVNNYNPHYEFASSSSTESESDEDDIAGLTRRFTRSVSLQERLKIPYPPEKKRVFSGSPEATLNRNVFGPSQARSSPTTPFAQANEDCWDLIYAAAEQVARMKMTMKMNTVNDAVFANRGLIGPPLSHHNYLPNCAIWSENEEFIRRLQFRRRVAGGANYDCSGPVGFRQSAWPPLPVETQHRQQPTVNSVLGGFGGGCGRGTAAVKKERAGTGVFLPRNYSNIPQESKKKPACSPTHMPAGVTTSFNKNINMDPTIAQPPPQPQPNIHGGFAGRYQVPPPPHHFKRDELEQLVTARRNAVVLEQQRRSATHAEVVLPQEWTY